MKKVIKLFWLLILLSWFTGCAVERSTCDSQVINKNYSKKINEPKTSY